MVCQIAKVIFMSLFPIIASAQIESVLNYNGQAHEAIKLDGIMQVIRPVVVQVPGTCIRQVPHQENVCRDITRTRQECARVPSRENCWTDYDNQCRSVTRYRQECSRGPSRTECEQVPTREVCTERPTRQECSTSPSREVCTDRPSRQECSTSPSRQVCTDRPSRQECTDRPSRQECSAGPSREVCTDVPGREVCVERPTREVCRVNSSGENVCTTVGGGQSCQTVGGGRSCRSVPGDQVCRTVGGGQDCRTVGGGQDCRTVGGEQSCRTVGGGQSCQTVGGEQSCRTVGGGQSCQTVGGGQTCHSVPGAESCRNVSYQDQECQQVPRERCETIPAHNECRDIPYSQNVCAMETVYKPESYACMKDEVQNQPLQKKVGANVEIDIKSNGLRAEFPIQILLAGLNPENSQFAVSAGLKQDPSVLVVLQKKDVKIVGETKGDITLEGSMLIEMIDPKTIPSVFPKRFNDVILDKKTSMLNAEVKGTVAAKGTIEMTITRRGKIIAELKDVYPSQKVNVIVERRKTTLAMNLTGLLQQPIRVDDEMVMTMKLGSAINIKGEILNIKKPLSEKTYTKVDAWVE